MPHDAPAAPRPAARAPDLDRALADLLDAAARRGYHLGVAGRRFARLTCPGCQDEWCVPLRPWVAASHLRRLRAYLALHHEHSMSTAAGPRPAVASAPPEPTVGEAR